MAHVHGAAGAAKAAAGHAAMGHGAAGMGAMMEHAGPLMAATPKHVAAGAAMTGTAIAASTSTGSSFMSTLSKHPLLVFGLGLAAGYMAHKYRKEIIAAATRMSEQSKDFVLHQKENLEDLVAECKECADDAGEAPAA